jgi:tetratricopeptide (TPR) repeat protein
MNSGYSKVLLLLVLWAGSSASAQIAPKDESPNKLPVDKTPEQFLALVALNLGVEEFKANHYENATIYFVEAKRLDPHLINARLYLATVHASQFVPAAKSQENIRHGTEAVSEFRETLAIEPANLSAIDGLGSILFQMAGTPFERGKLDEAKILFKRHSEISPGDPEPFYWVGVIDWTLAYQASKELRADLNKASDQLKDINPLPAELRQKYRTDFGAQIEEGILCMKKAISLRPDYDDAMAYLNMLYRRKTDTVTDEAERLQLINMADDLVAQAKEIKEKRAAQPK